MNTCDPAAYFGAWMVEPRWFTSAVAAVKAGTFKSEHRAAAPVGRGYTVSPDGVAVLRISGHMMKSESSFGGTSTVRTRRALRDAATDPGVSSILLHIESPGGTVAGTRELAQDVANVNRSKRVVAFIEDLGASAAYYVASHASKVYANSSALVGSIGTLLVLEDSSGKAEREGVVVHVLSTGPHKGVGIPGAKITPAQLAEEQRLVNTMGQTFVADVNAARGLKLEMGKGAADGRVFIASEALSLGLIDGILSAEQALAEAKTPPAKPGATAKASTPAGPDERTLRTLRQRKATIHNTSDWAGFDLACKAAGIAPTDARLTLRNEPAPARASTRFTTTTRN